MYYNDRGLIYYMSKVYLLIAIPLFTNSYIFKLHAISFSFKHLYAFANIYTGKTLKIIEGSVSNFWHNIPFSWRLKLVT